MPDEDEPVVPSDALDILGELPGNRIVEVRSYLGVTKDIDEYPGRLGGSTTAIEFDSGELIRFGSFDSPVEISVFVERDSEGNWHDVAPEQDESIRIVRPTDEDGDPALVRFSNAMIERVELLVLPREPHGSCDENLERGLVFHCPGIGRLVIAVGLDNEHAGAARPAVLLADDIPEAIDKLLVRRLIGVSTKPVAPSRALNLLKGVVGTRIVDVRSYSTASPGSHRSPRRLGGWTSAIELDSGDIIRFGLLASTGEISVFLERDSEGVWYDNPPQQDDGLRIVRATDENGDPTVARFYGALIDRVELLIAPRRRGVPFGEDEERALLFCCPGVGSLVIAVGLDNESMGPDLPAILLADDIPDSVNQVLIRRTIAER